MAKINSAHSKNDIILVSACLAGINCRHDGGNCLDPEIARMWRLGQAYPVCPERLGGMTTPRAPSEIVHGSGGDVILGDASVVNELGEDVTKFFVFGAWQTLKLVRELKIKRAILKNHSPSCGLGKIYREGRLVKGDGVCVFLLLQEGISIQSR